MRSRFILQFTRSGGHALKRDQCRPQFRGETSHACVCAFGGMLLPCFFTRRGTAETHPNFPAISPANFPADFPADFFIGRKSPPTPPQKKRRQKLRHKPRQNREAKPADFSAKEKLADISGTWPETCREQKIGQKNWRTNWPGKKRTLAG